MHMPACVHPFILVYRILIIVVINIAIVCIYRVITLICWIILWYLVQTYSGLICWVEHSTWRLMNTIWILYIFVFLLSISTNKCIGGTFVSGISSHNKQTLLSKSKTKSNRTNADTFADKYWTLVNWKLEWYACDRFGSR